MDENTATHLIAWGERALHADEREKVLAGIRRFVAEHPDTLETHSWPEIRRCAERCGLC